MLKLYFSNFFFALFSLLNIFTSSLFIFESLLHCRQDTLTMETEVLLVMMLSSLKICVIKFTIVYFDFASLTRSRFTTFCFV